MKDLNELKQMSVDELNNELLALRENQFNLRFKRASGSLDKTHMITKMRKSVARIKTILTEKAGE